MAGPVSNRKLFAAGAIGGNLSAACDAINAADKIAFKIGENGLSKRLFDIREQIAAILPELERLSATPEESRG